MNKLDEILLIYARRINDWYASPLAEDVDDLINRSIKEAKQAIIEFIEGEIIGEDENNEVSKITKNTADTSFFREGRNYLRNEQRQKLQKLKEYI